MKQHKKINSEQSTAKSTVQHCSSQAESAPTSAAAGMKAWREEIAMLQAQRFSSLDEALAALVEASMAKLDLREAERGPTREFLKLIFETDEALKAELQCCLTIESK